MAAKKTAKSAASRKSATKRKAQVPRRGASPDKSSSRSGSRSSLSGSDHRPAPRPKAAAAKAPASRKAPRAAGRRTGALSATPPPEDLTPAIPLTPSEIEEFRRLLLDKRAELVGDVGTLQDEALRGSRREASGDLSTMPVHMADLGTDNYEMEFTLGLLEGGRAMLREIDEALDRIRKGTYGVCSATGKPIGKARLKAKPWAKFCYEYTLALEKGQRQGT